MIVITVLAVVGALLPRSKKERIYRRGIYTFGNGKWFSG